MSANAREPAVVASPAVSMLSFTSTGRPCSGTTAPAVHTLSVAASRVVQRVGVERADRVGEGIDRVDPVQSGFDQRATGTGGRRHDPILAGGEEAYDLAA